MVIVFFFFFVIIAASSFSFLFVVHSSPGLLSMVLTRYAYSYVYICLHGGFFSRTAFSASNLGCDDMVLLWFTMPMSGVYMKPIDVLNPFCS